MSSIKHYVFAAALSMCACDSDEDPGRVAPRGANIPQGSLAPSVATSAADPFSPGATPGAAGTQTRVRTPGAPSVGGVQAAVAAPERAPGAQDFAPQLRALAGDPMSCGGVGDAPGDVIIALSASVSVTGVVIRASASGPIPAETRACLEGRMRSGRLSGPFDGPQTIRARLELARQEPEPAPEEPEPAPEPIGPGVQPIGGPNGTPIRAVTAMSIDMTPSIAIQPPSSTPIQAAPSMEIQPAPGSRPIGTGYGR